MRFFQTHALCIAVAVQHLHKQQFAAATGFMLDFFYAGNALHFFT